MTTWLNFTMVAAGGAVGSLARYLITLGSASLPGGSTMLGTTLSNLIGCAAIGAFSEYVIAVEHLSAPSQLAVRVGLLGGLTTFSTFAYESVGAGGIGAMGDFGVLRSGESDLGLDGTDICNDDGSRLDGMRIPMSWIASRFLICLIGLPIGWAAGAETASLPNQIPAYAQAQALRQDASFRSVAFNSDGIGIVCGDRGTIERSGDAGQTWESRESGVDCTLYQAQWVASNRIVILGGALDRMTGISRGVVLVSDDTGQTWKRAADQELPRLRSLQWEDEILVASGDWSDSLLTNRFESRDRGRSWHAGNARFTSDPPSAESGRLLRWVAATKTPVAIRDACRISEEALCAVGDHGVILVSRDEGETWAAARGEGRRTAVLMVARDPMTVPWALLGSEALESRSRVALLLQEASPGDRGVPDETERSLSNGSTTLDKTHQAAVALVPRASIPLGPWTPI